MAKFYGSVGYSETVETTPGVYTSRIIERDHYGDLLRNMSRWQAGNSLNDDLTINNQISIVADQYAYENFQSMKYVKFMGAKWKVTNVEVQRPRLILSVGGVYNG
jgi:hypothetical protein